MDERQARATADAHAQAVVDGDMDHVMGDIVPEARDSVGALAGRLPSPVTDAAVAEFRIEGETAIAEIRYSNADQVALLRSVWEQREEAAAPKIVAAEMVDP
jgi:hypothetical protein